MKNQTILIMKLIGYMSAIKIIKEISPIDIYSSLKKDIPCPTKEHIVPNKYLINSKMSKDLNNLFVCNYKINIERGILPYGKINDTKLSNIILDGRNGLRRDFNHDIDNKDLCIKTKNIFYPPPQSRGAIARTCLYMMDQYPVINHIIREKVLKYSILDEWNEEYPVEDWEKIRAINIYLKGYPLNKFIK